MAKVTITFEDLPNNQCSINLHGLTKRKILHPEDLTGAEQAAIQLLYLYGELNEVVNFSIEAEK